MPSQNYYSLIHKGITKPLKERDVGIINKYVTQ